MSYVSEQGVLKLGLVCGMGYLTNYPRAGNEAKQRLRAREYNILNSSLWSAEPYCMCSLTNYTLTVCSGAIQAGVG